MAHIRSVKLPKEKLGKLGIGEFSEYSSFFAASEPSLSVAGDWQTRFCCLRDSFQPVLEKLYNFEVREDDVWVVTSPKCGTTWALEMSWLILNDYNFEEAKSNDHTVRAPFLELNALFGNAVADTIEFINAMKSPRLIKSHLPAWLLPKELWTKKPKIIYVFRDPKDTAISYYHHVRNMTGYGGTKEEFMHSFMQCSGFNSPFWPYVLDFWQLREEPYIFFTSYERMKADLSSVIKGVCRFLNKSIEDKQLIELLDHLSFDKMKNNKTCAHSEEFAVANTLHGVKDADLR